jgi:DNA-binding response OmpR family regulator
VAVVDRADSSDRRALLDQGADEVVTRPLSPIRLLATARMLLGGALAQ